MNSLSKIFLSIIICAGICSCTERIDINTRSADTRIKIYGYITNDTMPHVISISYSDSYFSDAAPRPVSNATVTISTENTSFTLLESLEYPGYYLTAPDVCGEEGKTYILDVYADTDDNGISEHFRAQATMPYRTVVDSVKMQELQSIIPIPNLLLYGLIPDNQQNNLALYFTKNAPPETVLDYFTIVPDWYFKGYEIDGYEIPFMVEGGIEIGDTIYFRVCSFNDEFSEFLSHANSEIAGKNPLFSGPAVDVKTNIMPVDNDKSVVGFFSAFSWDEAFTISDRPYIRRE